MKINIPGVIAAWTFPTLAGPPDNSPAPNIGSGTATTLGMTNNYTNGAGTSGVAADDVINQAGTANPNINENQWRIRGSGNNGWADAAPEYTQGAELDTSTVGFSNIVFAFDWYSTTQGIGDLQVQYNTNGNAGTGSGWVNYQGPSPTGTFVATSNDFYNAALSPVSPTIYINLSNVPGASGNPDLGIRLVSAYDSTGLVTNSYASAVGEVSNLVEAVSDGPLNAGKSTATLTLTSPLTGTNTPYVQGNSIIVSGVTPSAYDGTFVIQSVNTATDQITYYIPGQGGLPDGTLSNTASITAMTPYNNNSGNWRFSNLFFYGNSTTTSTTVSASPAGRRTLARTSRSPPW